MNWEAATVGTLLDLVPITERAAIINTPDDMGNTAFHMAVREVNLDKVQVLLNAVPRNQRAAIVNHRNAQGRTPLQLLVSAAQRGAMDPPPWGPHPDAYIELVDYLLANGARLN
jgi:ankyrin repeat protein